MRFETSDGIAPSLSLISIQHIDTILEGIFITDLTGTIQAVNKFLSDSTGYLPSEIIGNDPSFLKSGKHPDGFYKKMWESLKENGLWQSEISNKRKNGEITTELLTISSIKRFDGEPTHYVGIFTNITAERRARETIRQMAYYDPLTGLPNRALFQDRFRAALQQMKDKNQEDALLAVLLLNLDRVKIINDTLGHAIGDHLLKIVAERIQKVLGAKDTIARLGGDEFLILLPAVKTEKNITTITERIRGVFKSPFHIDEHELYMTASIGVSVYPRDGGDEETLFKHADTAMHRAKKKGRNNYQLFHPQMRQEAFEQLELENSFRRALDREEFVLHYQPQIDALTGETIGMEALVRWQHPKFGLILPKRFIEWAEDTGLIVPLGEWVLNKACSQTMEWQQAGLPRIRVAVNLSARQFLETNLVGMVSSALKTSKLPPDCLDLELTESVVMENVKEEFPTPHELRALGIHFSIDDFGTGYSSLSYLKRFPAKTLKMDQSFVHDLTSDSHDATIATAVIALGHGLNLKVLAEGVETEPQMAILKSLKCDHMQGFLFSEPLPAEDFETLIRSKRHWSEDSLFHKTN